MGINLVQAREIVARLGGQYSVLTAWSAPTTKAQIEHREKSAAERQAEHRAIGRVKVDPSSVSYDEKGRMTFQFRVAGQVERVKDESGVWLNLKGEPCVTILIGAPTEYGYTTACPNAGVEGTACEGRQPNHCHRSVNLSRLVSWVQSGVDLI